MENIVCIAFLFPPFHELYILFFICIRKNNCIQEKDTFDNQTAAWDKVKTFCLHQVYIYCFSKWDIPGKQHEMLHTKTSTTTHQFHIYFHHRCA